MSEKDSAQDVIESYRKKRQQSVPFLVGGLAIVLVAVGIVALIVWFTGSNRPAISFLATDTPTISPTETITPTLTATPTASGPFVYTVEENDNLFTIADKFDVDVLVLMELNKLDYNSVIHPGDELLIPSPDLVLDTATPLPEGMHGVIEYTVLQGDNLEGIAAKFFSTVEAILNENEDLDNANEIYVGQKLKIPVNIATPVPTKTPGPAATLTQGALTQSPAATATP